MKLDQIMDATMKTNEIILNYSKQEIVEAVEFHARCSACRIMQAGDHGQEIRKMQTVVMGGDFDSFRVQVMLSNKVSPKKGK